MRTVTGCKPYDPIPDVGSWWIWEADLPSCTEIVEVVDVRWNSEEWWVVTRDGGWISYNELSRFWEACEPLFEGYVKPVQVWETEPVLDTADDERTAELARLTAVAEAARAHVAENSCVEHDRRSCTCGSPLEFTDMGVHEGLCDHYECEDGCLCCSLSALGAALEALDGGDRG